MPVEARWPMPKAPAELSGLLAALGTAPVVDPGGSARWIKFVTMKHEISQSYTVYDSRQAYKRRWFRRMRIARQAQQKQQYKPSMGSYPKLG